MRPAQRPVMRALLGAARQGPPAPAAERPEAEDRLALRVPALARRYRALLERHVLRTTDWVRLDRGTITEAEMNYILEEA